MSTPVHPLLTLRAKQTLQAALSNLGISVFFRTLRDSLVKQRVRYRFGAVPINKSWAGEWSQRESLNTLHQQKPERDDRFWGSGLRANRSCGTDCKQARELAPTL